MLISPRRSPDVLTGNLSPTRPVYGFISTSTPAKVGDGLEAAALALGVAASMTRYLALHAATSEGVVDGAPLATREPLGAAWRERCAPAGGRLVLLVRRWTDELRRAVMSAAADDAGLTRLAFVQARACVTVSYTQLTLPTKRIV